MIWDLGEKEREEEQNRERERSEMTNERDQRTEHCTSIIIIIPVYLKYNSHALFIGSYLIAIKS